ncbi:AGAP004701-PA-like protein [Anopheles sinensis]|uniref:AGAP004701-PA-like protein n=1 Tax=Anopheles sinensis TaxID=74873 RepID=A0A084W1A6_ANOSI|nr:AGAP004701-PA-like protein [Anopheles sinensis]
MLKWTVTKRSEASGGNVLSQGQVLMQKRRHARRSLGALSERIEAAGRNAVSNDGAGNGLATHHQIKLRRSLGTAVHGVANYDKENQCITSTPHPMTSSRTLDSPYSTALRDVSNITPNTTPCRLSTVSTPQSRKRTWATSPASAGQKRAPNQEITVLREPYATTLPTFDIEYSPCGGKNVPFLAIRGLGMTEFENPGRYFPTDDEEPSSKRCKVSEKQSMSDETAPKKAPVGAPGLTPLSSRFADLRFNKGSFKRPRSVAKTVNNNHLPPPETGVDAPEETNELSLNSSEMGDITLDKMIDAILESAKKDTRWATPRPKRSSSIKSKQSKGSSPTYTPADDPATDLYLLERRLPARIAQQAGDTTIILEETSHVNEREVKTPEPIREHQTTSSTRRGFRQSLNKLVLASPLEAACHLRRQKAVRRKHGKQESGGHPPEGGGVASIPRKDMQGRGASKSPETPNVAFSHSRIDQLALIKTPVHEGVCIFAPEEGTVELQKQQEQQLVSATATPSIRSIDLQGTSTPTESIEKTRKCLNFSPTLSEDSLEKRGSVASSMTSRCSRAGFVLGTGPTVRGTLELSIGFDQTGRLQVHVIRCRDLQRTQTGSTAGCNAINAYVKVALTNTGNTGSVQAGHTEFGPFQRTAVHRNSSRPIFDHRFFFDIQPDDERRIQLAVWHRDRECRRSEFLGCISFPVQSATKQDINGAYHLQPQSCLTNPIAPLPDTMCENSQSSVDEIVCAVDTTSSAMSLSAGVAAGTAPEGAGVTNTANTDHTNGASEPLSLSKKALHQRDADENLFLRFLELDPSPEVAPSGGCGNLPVPATPRRNSVCSSTKPASASLGRTPFTITKRLARTGDRGFGFSIVWTHPPRVEKVESGLSAEKAGILPGDYVVFVEKHNVVTMPEQDVLNLIRSQGNTLLLEIFRRPQQAGGQQSRSNGLRNSVTGPANPSVVGSSNAINFPPLNACAAIMPSLLDEPSLKTAAPYGVARSSTACSNFSIETAKRKLHLPQVTFSKESIVQPFPDDHRRKFLYQLISREQHFVNAINFGIERFVNPLRERKDLISPNDHKTLFQNIDELSRISEDILEQIIQDDTEPHIHFASRVYLSKSTALCAAYRKYCNGLKKADCVLVNKSRNSNCDFMKFITEPPVPRKRPDLTTFIHRPLQHFREILKLVQMIASHCRVDSEEHNNFNSIISELQIAYREITVGGGLMEPIGEGRPLLTLQDLEARMVFTKCKPFQLASHGRQWIFGGDLSRVEGRSIKPYWTLLFSDILLFAKVSRDRVLFITEEPIALSTITDSCFNIRKKSTEFRITTDPNGRQIESPTVHCAPDLTRTPKKSSKKRYIVLRAPSTELKAVWQNLLTRQIFLVNATLGSTPLSSPLDSPDILQSLVPISDIGATATTMASVKVPSLDSIHLKNQQVCSLGSLAQAPSCHSVSSASFHNASATVLSGKGFNGNVGKKLSTLSGRSNTVESRSNRSVTTIQGSISELPELILLHQSTNNWAMAGLATSRLHNGPLTKTNEFANDEINQNYITTSGVNIECENISCDDLPSSTVSSADVSNAQRGMVTLSSRDRILQSFSRGSRDNMRSIVEFSLSSVGRSFIDNADDSDPDRQSTSVAEEYVPTPETPPPNVSPSSSNKVSDTFSNDFKETTTPPSASVSPIAGDAGGQITNADCSKYLLASGYGGSWDLLELDLDFHQVNYDPSFGNDVTETEFLGDDDDPFGMLPTQPTPPNLLDL